jgi:hypothetical protein
MKMIGFEELSGYFDLSTDGIDTDTCGIYSCNVCYSLVLHLDLEGHVRWHLSRELSNKEKSPREIQSAAKRELGRIRRASDSGAIREAPSSHEAS